VIFSATSIPGAYTIETEFVADERGTFGRLFCASEFAERGLCASYTQSSLSRNPKAFTLRGMHFQAFPHEEVKLVRCTRGALFDVLVDLRRESPTYLEWFGVELTAKNALAVYIPGGVAHGFLTLSDDTEVLYHMDTEFHPQAARGIRWNDPAIGVVWPAEPRIMSSRDRDYPGLVL
jgi:dTDP-4-dehydrorhamnose 3,5-epimerase